MRLVEEPFVPPGALLPLFNLSRRSPRFQVLRFKRQLSSGLTISRSFGASTRSFRFRIFSALNIDAARAHRHGQDDVSRFFADRAQRLEKSEPGQEIATAIVKATQEMIARLAGAASWRNALPSSLRFQLEQQEASGRYILDEQEILVLWLARSWAWLGSDDPDVLKRALMELTRATFEIRQESRGFASMPVETFIGEVIRIDPDAAELVSDSGERRLVPRRELAREGLATVRQAVAVVREDLAGGLTAWSYSPAVRLPQDDSTDNFSPFRGPMATLVSDDEARWLRRVLSREPGVLPLSPFRLADR